MSSLVLLSPLHLFFFFFFNDTATTEIYTLSLHDALPILIEGLWALRFGRESDSGHGHEDDERSEEHTSELQSPCNLVCRLLLEKKKKKEKNNYYTHNINRQRQCSVPRREAFIATDQARTH